MDLGSIILVICFFFPHNRRVKKVSKWVKKAMSDSGGGLVILRRSCFNSVSPFSLSLSPLFLPIFISSAPCSFYLGVFHIVVSLVFSSFSSDCFLFFVIQNA